MAEDKIFDDNKKGRGRPKKEDAAPVEDAAPAEVKLEKPAKVAPIVAAPVAPAPVPPGKWDPSKAVGVRDIPKFRAQVAAHNLRAAEEAAKEKKYL